MNYLTVAELTSEIALRAAEHDRFLVGIAGAPGSGKSTIADALANELGPISAVVPMDGFHLENDRLTELGLLHRKGAPETFDASGFVAFITTLRKVNTTTFPTFDREADRTVSNGGLVDKEIKVILIEGNYLLLNKRPWSELPRLFDITVKLEVGREVLFERLVQRWRDHGLSEEAATERALHNDMVNVDLIAGNSLEPDYWVGSNS